MADKSTTSLTAATSLAANDLLYAAASGNSRKITVANLLTNLPAGYIANASLADMAQATIKGRAAAAGTGAPADLSAAQVKTILAIDHGADLAGLLDDDHTQYALLAGRAGGQTLIGGTAASENLILDPTSHATKGGVVPAANDGGSLGVSGTAFSDLFLASGAVVNFADSDFTVTHSTGNLAFSGSITAPTLYGSAASGGALTISSTSHATKGLINFGIAALIDEANGRLAIGELDTAVVVNGTTYNARLITHGDGTGDIEVHVHRHSDSAAFGPSFSAGRSRGTEGAETIVQNGDALLMIDALGHDGTDYAYGARIIFEVDGPPSNNDMPACIRFLTTADGASTSTEAMRINSDQSVQISSLLRPDASDGSALGNATYPWSDAFFASGAVIDFASDVTITHSANTLTFAGAISGYTFDAALLPSADDSAALGVSGTAFSDLFLASGGVINFAGDVTITHAANALAFAGASDGCTFDGPVAANTTIKTITLATNTLTIPLSVYGTDFINTLQRRHSDTVAAAAGLYFARSRGSLGSETAVSSGDRVVNICGIAHDGTDYANCGQIRLTVDAAPGSDNMPGRWDFLTCPAGSQTLIEAFKIDSSQAVLAVSATGGLGYGTGAGGAVEQITSRTTGVTLNTVCGAITLVSAAGSTSWQTFTVTNSAVAETDNVHVSQKYGADLNEIHVTAVAAGSFNITFRTTGGTTTEQPVLKFTVIKAVEA